MTATSHSPASSNGLHLDLDPRTVARPWGWREPGGGRASHVEAGKLFQGTTSQLAGLYPFMAGSGSPVVGVPIGRHMHWGEVVCLDPLGWLNAGLVTNPGVFVLGQPGCGKALDVDTPIPTPTGVARLGDLVPGDAVFDEHGQSTTVVAVSETWTERDCLQVCFSDGTSVVADAEHLWVTETQPVRQRRLVERLRPASRRRLGSVAEQQRIAALLQRSHAGQTTTLLRLADELGWRTDQRWQRLYRWAKKLQPVAHGARGRVYDKVQLLEQVAMAINAPINDQSATAARPEPVTTRHIAQTLRFNGKTNHAIAVAPCLELASADVPVDPYVLGAWLGDGNSHSAHITSADQQIIDRITAAGFDARPQGAYRYAISLARTRSPRLSASLACQLCGMVFTPRHAWQRYCSRSCGSRGGRVNPSTPRSCDDCYCVLPRTSVGFRCRTCHTHTTLAGRLRNLGVLGNKHIPAIYLRASESQRRSLFAGLLDTDGTVSPNGQVQYTSTNARLASDVFDLVCSLGYRATMQTGRARLRGNDCGPKWTIAFTTSDSVFGLTRKQNALDQRRRSCGNARTRVRYIVDVQPVSSRPVRCIQVANPSGMFLVTRACIATHNSTIAKRLVAGMCAYGTQTLILGDTKPDYTPLVRHLGGQVIEVGRGMASINPLDAGSLGQALASMTDAAADRLRREIRGRRISLMLALCALVRGHALSNAEEVILSRAIDLLTEDPAAQPTIPDVLRVLEAGPEMMRQAARTSTLRSEAAYHTYFDRVRELVYTLDLLCEGSLKGIFDQPTSTPMDLGAPAVSVDISRVAAAGDTLVAAAMLCTWAYGYAMVDAAAVLAEQGLAPRRQFLAVMDELWRALRGAAGLVEHADALTRLNRQRGMASVMITHSLKDLDALPTEEDRAKARGFAERSAITILAGLPMAELQRINPITPLTEPEMNMVKSWAAPESWLAGAAHPGRGKYLIKTGDRLGIPVELTLVGEEARLYDTDAAVRQPGGLI